MPGVFTNESGAYNSLGNHEAVNHSDGECVRGKVRINGIWPRSGRIESFWALVRRGYNGTARRIGPKHLHRYVNEFAGRLGMRALGAVGRMRTIVQNLAGKRSTCGHLVATGAPCGRP